MKKKILITDYTVSKRVLSNSSLLALIDSDESNDFNIIFVFNMDCDINVELKKRGYKTYICQYGSPNFGKNLLQHILIPFKYLRILYKEKPDVIYANNVMSAKSGVIFKYLSFKPLFLHIRNVGFFKRTKFFSLFADYFLCVSNYCMRNTLPKKYHSRAAVVYDGVSIKEHINIRNTYEGFSKSYKDMVIGMVGRITSQKGQDYFVKLANSLSAKYPNVIFAHCGEKPHSINTPYSKSLIDKSFEITSLKKFFWFDYNDNIEEFWSIVDIAIVPSQNDEAFGRVIIEAMSLGIPVISTESGGPQEIIQHNLNGLCVDKKNYEMLEDGLKSLIENPNIRKKFAIAGKKTIKEKFSYEIYSKNIFNTFKKLWEA